MTDITPGALVTVNGTGLYTVVRPAEDGTSNFYLVDGDQRHALKWEWFDVVAHRISLRVVVPGDPGQVVAGSPEEGVRIMPCPSCGKDVVCTADGYHAKPLDILACEHCSAELEVGLGVLLLAEDVGIHVRGLGRPHFSIYCRDDRVRQRGSLPDLVHREATNKRYRQAGSGFGGSRQ